MAILFQILHHILSYPKAGSADITSKCRTGFVHKQDPNHERYKTDSMLIMPKGEEACLSGKQPTLSIGLF